MPTPRDLRAVHAGLRQQFRHRRGDLPADAVRPGGDIDRAAPQAGERAVAGAEAELQFRAADFDAEVHEPVVLLGLCNESWLPV